MENLTNLKMVREIKEVAIQQVEALVDETGLDWREDLAPNELYEMLVEYSDEWDKDWNNETVKEVAQLVYILDLINR